MVLNKVPTGVQLYSSAIHVGCAKADHPIWVPRRCIGSIAVNRKKKDGEVCHFSRFSKISKHHWFLPSFWSTSASLKKVCWFLILKSKICKPFRERSKNSTCKTGISTSGRLPGCPCHQLRDHFQPYHLGTTRAWISLQIPFVREDWSPVISIYLSKLI